MFQGPTIKYFHDSSKIEIDFSTGRKLGSNHLISKLNYLALLKDMEDECLTSEDWSAIELGLKILKYSREGKI